VNRLRIRLLAVVLLAALLPAVPLTLVVRGLLERSTGPVVQDRLERGLQAGLAAAREELRRHGRRLLATADSVAALPRGGRPAGGVLLLDEAGRPVAIDPATAESLAAAGLPPRRPVRRGGRLLVAVATADGRRLVVGRQLPDTTVARARQLTDAVSLLRGMRLARRQVLRSYVLPFILVYGLLILAAVALAGWAARGVARPLEELAAATRAVAAGDLSVRVVPRGSRELRSLMAAFNGMVADLARQRRVLARLEKLAAWRGMARVLAHEIKNPLTPILLAVQQATRSYRGDDARFAAVLRECEAIVTEEVEGLRELVSQFSAFARLPEPVPRDEDLRPLLDELVRLYGERLSVAAADGPRPARCDPAALRRALVNLVDNGLQACARAGQPERVRVTVARDDEAVRIAVADAGDGVPPDLRERIFEPDFSTRRDGMGLGLAIADGIVRGHGGRIDLDSEPGRGSVFTIVLPHRGEEPTCPPS